MTDTRTEQPWEHLGYDFRRTAVPGGWLYERRDTYAIALAFVPHPITRQSNNPVPSWPPMNGWSCP